MAFDHQRKFLPSNKTLLCLFVFGCFALGFSLWVSRGGEADLQRLLLTLLLAFTVLMVFDWHLAKQISPVRISRQLATGLALNQWADVSLEIQHELRNPQSIEVFDNLPNTVRAQAQRAIVPLLPGQVTRQSYRLRPIQRGPLNLNSCHVRLTSPLALWTIQYRVHCNSEAKVYPDFAAISAYTILATENHVSQVGIRRKNRRGQGLDFHQLREYRQGDSLRQLDWKATARRQALISKDYQDERDQNVILMIDSGRRMRSKDDELDHFDHALNASLLIAYIALRQGDSVGVMSFGNGERWISPQKGSDRINVILNSLYDLQTCNRAPDYLSAAEKLTLLQRKRSLIILVTNTRDEELDEMTLALQLLRKRHVVLVANIREAILDATLNTPVEGFDEALTYCGTVDFVNQRRKVQKMLSSKGIFAVDCLAKELPIQLANSYWDIKRSGTL